MAPQDIPGYYWDLEKRRYFKVEQSMTAPPNAAWSSEAVKKRELEDAESVAQNRRLHLNKDRIKRSRVLTDPVMGGFLDREIGKATPDFVAGRFARDLVIDGKAVLIHQHWHSFHDMAVASSRSKPGMCIAFTSAATADIRATPIIRDAARRRVKGLPPVQTAIDYTQLLIKFSDLKYCEHADYLLAFDDGVDAPRSRLWLFRPDTIKPEPTEYRGVRLGKLRRETSGRIICPTPQGCDIICIIGTDSGLVKCTSSGNMEHLLQYSWDLAYENNYNFVRAITIRPDQPNVMYFGGRAGVIMTADMREIPRSWRSCQLPAAITHLKQVGDHQLLAAGLDGMLSIYDIRQSLNPRVQPPTAGRGPVAKPLLQISGYRNRARYDIGLDFHKDTGVLAAAHDDGKVALYSVRSGRRLASPDIDSCHHKRPIRFLQFQTFSGETLPSLFVGTRRRTYVFSLGVYPDDEA